MKLKKNLENENLIKEELYKCSKKHRWIDRYIKFINHYMSYNIEENSETHHILPSSMYPKYKNLNTNKFNKAVLSLRAHYIAHYMLAKIFGDKMWYAFNMMKRAIPGDVKKSSLYIVSRKYISKVISKANKGRVNTPEQCLAVSEATKNTFVCEDEYGNRFRASKDDHRLASGEIWSYRVGYKHKESTKKKMSKNGIKDKTCYTKDGNIKYFSEDEIIDSGWKRGDYTKKNVPKEYGLNWYSNMVTKESKRFDTCPDGWIKGRKFNTTGFDNINNSNEVSVIDIHKLINIKIKKMDYSKMNNVKYNNTDKYRFIIFKIENKYFGSISEVDRYMRKINIFDDKSTCNDWKNKQDEIITKRSTCKPTKLSIYLRKFIGKKYSEVLEVIDLSIIKEEERYNILLYKGDE